MTCDPVNILLIEDNPGDVRLIQELLSETANTAHTLVSADTLMKGLTMLGEQEFDVILLDLGLPDSQGLETLEKVLHAALPTVVLTGLNDEAIALAAVRCGAQDYLVKGDFAGHVLWRVIVYAIERAQMETALRKSEMHLRKAQELGRIGSWEYEFSSGKAEWSPELFRIYERDDGLSPSAGDSAHCYPPGLNEVFQDYIGEAPRTQEETIREVKMQLPSGRTVFLNCIIQPVLDAGGRITKLFGTVQDITERRQAEELFRILADSSPLGVYILQEGKFVYTNPQFQKFTGYSESELAGKNSLSLVFPEDREKVRENTVRALKGFANMPCEFQIVTRSGEVRWALETVESVEYKGKQATIGSYQDITEHKKMQEQLIVTDRLASIGQLVSGIAHELNNPLTGIIGLAQLSLTSQDRDDILENIALIHKEARRAANIVKNFLTFSRRQRPQTGYINVNEVINAVLELRSHEYRVKNIKTVTHLGSGLPPVLADRLQIQQVFLNIVINAEQAMLDAHGRGTLSIISKNVENAVRVHFSDTGPGILAENLSRIFDPFFTTKETGKGTGLGLSICHGIVTAHEGRIWAESKPDAGATFIIELPVA